MRYPVGDGTKEAFERDWYVAQGFGAATSYGFHEGVDINLRTGGDTDLGQLVYAIADASVVYWHYGSHPATGFGRHLIYRIVGPWGVRWVHQAHLGEDGFRSLAGSISEGTVVGQVGKSGNSPLAHLHFAILKVDPGSNLDNIANSGQAELDANWEDPLAFIERWMATGLVITDSTHIPQISNHTVAEIRTELHNLQGKLAAVRSILA